MDVVTMQDLGVAVRNARRQAAMTQDDLATRIHATREWVARLERGAPRLQGQKVLDALQGVGLVLTVHAAEPAEADDDPFADVLGPLTGDR